MYHKHGKKGTRLYRIWCNMIQRCTNRNNSRYPDYGGRGIKIYSEWFDFQNFLKWAMDSGYSDDLTLDREDNSGNYTPFNCRWVSRVEQQNNRRGNRIVEYNCESHTIAQWSEITGLRANTIITRLNRGWSVQDSLTVPIGGKYGNRKKEI